LTWFKSYLTDRKQRVKFNEEISESIEVKLGVPQGTVLGPILFLVYVNSIERALKNCRIKMFADDTVIYVSGKNMSEMVLKMNEDLKNYSDTLKSRKLSLNIDKTVYQIIKPKNKCLQEENMSVEIDNRSLKRVYTVKYLGVQIDDNLTFKENGEYVCQKVAKKLSYFARVAKRVPIYCRVTLYNTMILPYFNYCSSVLFMNDGGVLRELQLLQNKAMRVILRCSRYTRIDDMLKILQWMNVKTRIIFSVLLYVHKIKNGLIPSYIRGNVKLVKDKTNVNLRNRDDFYVSVKNKRSTESTVFHRGFVMFNNLPISLKKETNFEKFRKLLLEYLTNNSL
jgi:hypothetical protein